VENMNMHAIECLITSRVQQAVNDANVPIMAENQKKQEALKIIEVQVQAIYEKAVLSMIQHPVKGRSFDNGSLRVTARLTHNYCQPGNTTYPFVDISIEYSAEDRNNNPLDSHAYSPYNPYVPPLGGPDFNGWNIFPVDMNDVNDRIRQNYVDDSDNLSMRLNIRRKLPAKFAEELKKCEEERVINAYHLIQELAKEKAAEIVLRGGDLLAGAEAAIQEVIKKVIPEKTRA